MSVLPPQSLEIPEGINITKLNDALDRILSTSPNTI
jgi:hypothetical protein